jgi:spore maturation protein CgeB
MPYIFASSKININISLRSILTGIPLRVVDIIGAGGFCLTNYQAEMSEYFENGRELVWFESPGDMVEKADYFLHHDDEREKIAINGAEAAERIFSYDVLLPKVLDIF